MASSVVQINSLPKNEVNGFSSIPVTYRVRDITMKGETAPKMYKVCL